MVDQVIQAASRHLHAPLFEMILSLHQLSAKVNEWDSVGELNAWLLTKPLGTLRATPPPRSL
ncbi:hypothetical protein CPB86DRAFT_792093, partial [Serendipita vermifera]